MATNLSERPLSVVVSKVRANGKPGWSVRTWHRNDVGKVVGTVNWSDLNINTDASELTARAAAHALLTEDGSDAFTLVRFRSGWATADVVEAYQ